MQDNEAVFRQSEFDQWADREGLERGEHFLITNYLDRQAKTLEAGSGGGRILLNMQALGFRDLHGFDYLQEFVDVARRRDTSGKIDFRVLDASALDYPDNSFDQLVYVQQLLCLIDDDDRRLRSIREAYRVLRPGGVMIVTMLSLRARRQSLLYRTYMAYIALLRRLRGSRVSIQHLPWMRLQNRPNIAAMWDRAPYVYWIGDREAVELLQGVGFEVVAIGSEVQVEDGQLLDSVEALEKARYKSRLYLVARKPK